MLVMDMGCIPHSWKSIPCLRKSIPYSRKIISKPHSPSFTSLSRDESVFRAVKNLNGYCLSAQMKWAQNSDSKTHVKKVKCDIQNRNQTKITKVPFFRDTLYFFNLFTEREIVEDCVAVILPPQLTLQHLFCNFSNFFPEPSLLSQNSNSRVLSVYWAFIWLQFIK